MNQTIELKVPPDARYSSLVGSVVEDAAWRANLESSARRNLTDAARRAFERIVCPSLDEDRDPVRLKIDTLPQMLRVAFIERGIPADDRGLSNNAQWLEIAALVDHAHAQLHGRAGSELALEMNRTNLNPEQFSEPVQAPDVALAPEQTYTIRRFQPDDAPGIARAFYLTYGYHYDFSPVYDPARLTALNAANAYASIIAAAENGEIAGHYALSSDPGAVVAEGCGAVVVPAHRGRNLLALMRATAEEEAKTLGMAAYFSEPVTSHGRTQSESIKFGAHLCGITLGAAPQSFQARHMALTATAQRASCTLYFKPLAQRESRALYAPVRHRAMIEKIYAGLTLPITMQDGALPGESSGRISTSVSKSDAIATIEVHAIGTTTPDVIAQAVSDLRAGGRMGAIYLRLPLEDAATPQLCEKAEALGFYFSGVGPWMLEGKDALRLQMTLTPIDISALTIVGGFGEELRAYIAQASTG